ncbi:hypothetical protein MAPG_05665 [Magnaporthiopsis poae ATCC 64411]|uniref:Uncharacterized protein n=1 Tax=Magnaporthiopsis poae (strain ATCC 64411 / 73-15) TaxID=644358 RepID=A0A0C4E001_MAGP6|nr:hypothetical protein MAPG_05665 [Magnaporthiopsis poae ATCC 64411]
MLQTSFIHLRLLLVACFVATAKADGWDDFANNLATDLAPLLALFGEQATKQFLSESTTIWDNIIFAMAPLGILTAVVSAIRVCGGPSLRAFIGRAQEGGGIAEAELCSSTSRDVCELHQNGAIVRVFGRPKILEIVHDREAALPDGSGPPDYGIYSFREYIKTDWARKAGWEELKEAGWKRLVKVGWKWLGDAWREFREAEWKQRVEVAWERLREAWKGLAMAGRWVLRMRHEVDSEAATPQENPASDDTFAPNPNLSFNIGIREPPKHVIRLAATVGFLAQASVVVFGFLVTYTWGWTKGEGLPQAWAFPFMSLGTVLLCAGMFSCALLVEKSTEERVFGRDRDNDRQVPIYVVQPGNQTVGDQTFDSFSFTDASRPSRRYTTSWKVPRQAELGVWLAVGATMSGFVFQFVGLRAMHSAVSVLQLGVILLMSIIRAGLRTRRLGEEQNLLRDRLDQVEGYELDWLAFELTKAKPGEKDEGRKFWSLTAGPTKLYSPPDDQEPRPDTDFRRAFFYRSRLAEMTSQQKRVKSRPSTAWDERYVHVRQQARQLKKAIESSADVFFAQAKMHPDLDRAKPISWAIDVAEYRQSEPCPKEPGHKHSESCVTGKEASKIDLSLHRPKNDEQSTAWEVSQQCLEAVVGLWAWSIISDPRLEEDHKSKLQELTAPEVTMSRIIALGNTREDIERAKTDLELWIEDFPSSVSTATWTAGSDPRDKGPDILWETETQSSETVRHLTATTNSPNPRWNQSRLRLFGWPIAPHDKRPIVPHGSPAETSTKMFALTTIVNPDNHSIPTTCAHDIYQLFLCAITARLESLGGQTKPSTGSRGFYFTNEVVSRLAECFKESGLGSIQDAYSVIIPALRCRPELLSAGGALPAVHSVAENARKEGNFQEAEAMLKWAWQTALRTGDDGALDSTMLELGELYRNALFWKDGPQEEFSSKGIFWMKGETDKQPSSSSVAIISRRYADLAQRTVGHPRRKSNARDIIDAISRDDRTESLWLISQVDDILPAHDDGRTVLSWAAQRGWQEIVKAALGIGSAID